MLIKDLHQRELKLAVSQKREKIFNKKINEIINDSHKLKNIFISPNQLNKFNIQIKT